MSDKIRKTFIENEIMTAITKMIDNPKENGVYLDHECTAEIVEISERYWNTELCDAHDALRAMRALNKAASNNLKDRDEEIKKLIKFEKIDKIRIEESLAEIKKLKAQADCWRVQYMKLYKRG